MVVGKAAVLDSFHALKEEESRNGPKWEVAALVCGPGISSKLGWDDDVRIGVEEFASSAMPFPLLLNLAPNAVGALCEAHNWSGSLRALGIKGGERPSNDIVAVLQHVATPQSLPAGSKPLTPGLSLWLDGVSDPGNVGTLIRSAAFVGVKRVLMTENCARPFGHKVVAASCGTSLCLDCSDVAHGSLASVVAGSTDSLARQASPCTRRYAVVVAEAGSAGCADKMEAGGGWPDGRGRSGTGPRPGQVLLEPFVGDEAGVHGDRSTRSEELWRRVHSAPTRLLVLGSEGSGLSDELRRELQHLARSESGEGGGLVVRACVQGMTQGWAGSPGACLNVSAAGAIMMANLAADARC